MCEYCEEEKPIKDNGSAVWVIDGLLLIGNCGIKIHYCPMCGKKLDEQKPL